MRRLEYWILIGAIIVTLWAETRLSHLFYRLAHRMGKVSGLTDTQINYLVVESKKEALNDH